LQRELQRLREEQAKLVAQVQTQPPPEAQRLQEEISRLKDRLVGQLKVFVGEARDLRGLGIGGKSDPYAVITLDKQKEKTTQLKKTNNPKWNQEYEFYVADQSWMLTITIFDHSKLGADEFLGKIDIPVRELEEGRPLNRWFTLQAKKPGGKVSGEIKLSLLYQIAMQ